MHEKLTNNESQSTTSNAIIDRREFMLMAAGAAATLSMSHPSSAALVLDSSAELAMLSLAESSKNIHSGAISCTEPTHACIQRY